jgi:hypothetical protein
MIVNGTMACGTTKASMELERRNTKLGDSSFECFTEYRVVEYITFPVFLTFHVIWDCELGLLGWNVKR